MKIVNTTKKIVLIKLGLLICASSFTSKTKSVTSEEAFIGGCAIVATVAVGTIVYYRLNPSINTIKAKSVESLQKAIAYDSTIQILNRKYNINYLSPLDQRKVVDTIDEYTLNDLYFHVNSASSPENYLSKLHYLLEDLRYCQEKIESKFRGSNNISELEGNILRELLSKTKRSINELGFLNLYVSSHLSFFKLQSTFSNLSQKFNIEINIINKYPGYQKNLTYNPLVEEIKASIRGKYFNELYPLTRFVNDVNIDLNKLDNETNKLVYNYTFIKNLSYKLKSELTFIKSCVTGSTEYLNEKQMQENARKEKEKLALKEREVQAKEVEAKAKKQEAEARERQAEAKELELQIKQQELALKEQELRDRQQANQVQG